MSLNVVALPGTFSPALPGVRINFVLDAGSSGFDMTTATAARLHIERPDHSFIEWSLTKEGAVPAPTTQDVTFYRNAVPADFQTGDGYSLGGTYVARAFATFSAVPAGQVAGEQAMGRLSFAVEQAT